LYGDWSNYFSGKGVCELKSFSWFQGSADFDTELVNYSIAGVYFLAVGDVDNDGWEDIVTTQPFVNGPSYQFSVSLSDGDGTFASPVNYLAGNNPWFIVLGDVDNDGWLDAVFFNWWDNTLSVSLNDGDGTYGSPTVYSVGAPARYLLLGDVNNDGWLDIIVPKSGNPSNLGVFINDGDGTFASGVDYQVGVGVHQIALGDIDKDGWLDVVTGNSGSAYVSVSLNDGDGTFAAQTTYSTGNYPIGVSLGDVDGDGWLDIIAVVSNGNIAVFLNDGDGTFASAVNYPVTSFPAPEYVSLGDVDNDGWLDIVVTHKYQGDFGEYEVLLSVSLNDGDGTFASPVNYPFRPYSPAGLYDLDHDGDLDMIFADIGSKFSISENPIINSGSNGPCCGDDGASDDFSNSTHQCINGVFSEI